VQLNADFENVTSLLPSKVVVANKSGDAPFEIMKSVLVATAVTTSFLGDENLVQTTNMVFRPPPTKPNKGRVVHVGRPFPLGIQFAIDIKRNLALFPHHHTMVPTCFEYFCFPIIDVLTTALENEEARFPIDACTHCPESSTVSFDNHVGVEFLGFHPATHAEITVGKIKQIIVRYDDKIWGAVKFQTAAEFAFNPFQAFVEFTIILSALFLWMSANNHQILTARSSELRIIVTS
jgi:hypothetical protein